MKLTIEENREALKRYRHIRPAPQKGPARCSALCPGTVRTCSLRRGHSGPHVAHGLFGRVVAVWDKGVKGGKAPVRKKAAPTSEAMARRARSRERGFLAAIKALRKSISLKEHYIEAGLFLAFALAMVGFAIDWALRIMGLK